MLLLNEKIPKAEGLVEFVYTQLDGYIVLEKLLVDEVKNILKDGEREPWVAHVPYAQRGLACVPLSHHLDHVGLPRKKVGNHIAQHALVDLLIGVLVKDDPVEAVGLILHNHLVVVHLEGMRLFGLFELRLADDEADAVGALSRALVRLVREERVAFLLHSHGRVRFIKIKLISKLQGCLSCQQSTSSQRQDEKKRREPPPRASLWRVACRTCHRFSMKPKCRQLSDRVWILQFPATMNFSSGP